MNRKILSTTALSLAMLGFTANVNAQDSYEVLPEGTYQLDKTHASLSWKVSHLGLSNYTARFTDFDASIEYNPENIEESKVSVTVDPTSLRTDYPYAEKKDFDKKLSHGEDWFNAQEFPEITFTSTNIDMNDDDTGVMTGNLTFLGVTKPITLDVTLNGAYIAHPFNQKPALGFSAEGRLKRSDFGFETYIPNIGDEVQLLIETEFAKK